MCEMISETGHNLYETGCRMMRNNALNGVVLDGVYIASKSEITNKSPVQQKQLEKIITPGNVVETWKDGELIETLDPGKYLSSNEFFKRFGEFPVGDLPDPPISSDGILKWPETSIAVIRNRRLKK